MSGSTRGRLRPSVGEHRERLQRTGVNGYVPLSVALGLRTEAGRVRRHALVPWITHGCEGQHESVEFRASVNVLFGGAPSKEKR